MTKNITLLGLASALVLTSCGDVRRISVDDLPREDAEPTISPDAGPPCDPDDLMSLQTDFANCGSCGTQCSVDDSDRCVNGFCQCGNGPTCTEGSDCIAGRCLESDRFTECSSNEDCPNESGDQQCLSDGLADTGFCVDVCEFSDDCPNGFACVEGACTRQECAAEGCDGIDNDCDGLIDENSDSTGPLSQWCLTGGDPTTVPLPPCVRGTQICSAGVWSPCRDEVPPEPEVGIFACNLRDDDCDGCVDGTYDEAGVCVTNPPSGFDVLFIIDVSSSMFGVLTAVKAAMATFASVYESNPEFRFAIELVSGRGVFDDRAYVVQDFTNYTMFMNSLNNITVIGGSSEPIWDAVYEASMGQVAHAIDTTGDGSIDSIDEGRRGLAWRDNSIRIMIMFGDEQGYTSRETRGLGRVNEHVMCDSLTHGEFFVMFGNRLNQNDVDECARFYELSSDADVMAMHLSGVIVDPCL